MMFNLENCTGTPGGINFYHSQKFIFIFDSDLVHTYTSARTPTQQTQIFLR